MRKILTFPITIALLVAVTSQAEISGSGHQIEGCYGAVDSFVWNDVNGNGSQDAGEPPLVGVALGLSLRNQPEYGEDLLVTDGSGRVNFFNLCLRSYLLRVDAATIPAGMTPTIEGDDTDDRDVFDSEGDAELEPVRIDLHENHVVEETVDFGFRRTSCVGAIGDRIFVDDDGDGMQSPLDAGLAGVAVRLLDAAGADLGVSITDDDGYYLFDNLCDGVYAVDVDESSLTAAGYLSSPTGAGADAGNDSDQPADGGAVMAIVDGGRDLSVDFGFLLPGCAARLVGNLFLDSNDDGVEDAGENGVEDVTLVATGEDGSQHFAITGGGGSFRFSGLCAGSYSLSPEADSLPPGVVLGADPTALLTVTLPGNDVQVDLSDIGLPAVCSGEIGDRVWLDGDGDGRQDAIEPGLAAVTVNLRDDQGNVVANVLSDEDGYYGFHGLCPGDYAIQVNLTSVDGSLSPSPANIGNPEFDSGGAAPVWVTLADAATAIRDVDFGFASDACTLALSSGCAPLSEEARAYSCHDRMDLLTMIWDGAIPVRVVAHSGDVDQPVVADIDQIQPGQAVTIRGFEDGDKDVLWEVFHAGGGARIGDSWFQLSCSDSAMNGPEDCRSRQGDGKNGDRCGADGCVNDWLLEEIVDKEGRLLCTAPDAVVADKCSFTGDGLVSYRHTVTNIGTDTVMALVVSDSLLGEPADGIVDSLAPGGSRSVAVIDEVAGSRSHVVNAVAEDANSACRPAADTLDVTVLATPACAVTGRGFLDLDHDKFKWRLDNVGTNDVTISRIDISWHAEHGVTKEIKLDGDKIVDIDMPAPAATYTGAYFVGAQDKRRIEQGKDADLEVKFAEHSHDRLHTDYTVDVEFEEGCSVSFTNTGLPYKCTSAVREIRMIWDGDAEPVTIRGYRGKPTDELMFEVEDVMRGDVVVHSGLDGSKNDIHWEIFAGGTLIGESMFNVSCGDNAMKAAQHCGRRQGDGKDDKDHLANDWLLHGMVDDDGPFECPTR